MFAVLLCRCGEMAMFAVAMWRNADVGCVGMTMLCCCVMWQTGGGVVLLADVTKRRYVVVLLY
jgi:hypothetical protein